MKPEALIQVEHLNKFFGKLQVLKDISESILHERYYQALKLTKKLIEYEQEVVNHVRRAS